MKSRFFLAWVVVGLALTISRLAAQDVTVTDPAWFDPENAPADQPPRFKKTVNVDFPEELKKPEQVAYIIVEQIIGEKGERLHRNLLGSNPYAEKAVVSDEKFSPALRGAKPVSANCWYGIIFNPRSAKQHGDEASPRLLAVAPIVVEKTALPEGVQTPSVIWATLSLDQKGQLQKYVFDDPAFEVLRPQVGGALHRWRFAPARAGGQLVSAELRVPLILAQTYRVTMPSTAPKAIHREEPEYPRAMVASRFRGAVVVQFVVAKDGTVKDPVVIQTNNPGFNEAAIDAMMKWRFEPGRKLGEPVNVRMQQSFEFDFTNGQGRDYAAVETSAKRDQAKMPEQYRYDIAPQPKGVLTPVYPYALLRDQVKGKAVVAFLVDPKGRVAKVEVVEATKPEFGLAMVAAVEAFRFIPAMKDGKATATILKMEQEFSPGTFGKCVAEKDQDLIKLERKHPEKILSAAKLDAPLKPVSRQPPIFPVCVMNRLDHGSATIEVLINEEGRACLPRIAEATDPAFGYAAMQALTDWRFEPPMAGGKPAVARVQVPFDFELAGYAAGREAAEKRADEAEGKQR